MTAGEPPRPLLQPLPSMRPTVSAATVVLVAGLASLVVLGAVQLLRDRLVRREIEVSVAAREVRVDLATSHVWIEEYLSGDRIDPDEYWSGIRRSLAVLDAMVDGGELRVGPWLVHRVSDPTVRGRAAELRVALRRYELATRERLAAFERGEPAAPGSALDAAYDLEFRALAEGSVRLQEAAESRLAAGLRRLDAVFYATLVGWTILVLAAFLAVRRFQQRRAQAEAALRERELQLIRAQKLEAVGALAGGIAHDINNYLAAIRAQAELVLRQPSSEAVHDKMRAVVGSVETAAWLVRQLLAFARRQPMRPEVLDLNAVVAGWQAMVAPSLGAAIALDLRLGAGVWPVRIDGGQLEQIGVNLLLNARDAMPDGGAITVTTMNATLPAAGEPSMDGSIALDARRSRELALALPAGEYVVLTVADTGPGVPATIADRIFEPFFTTREGRGNTGLGLATVHGIVEQNGGKVWVATAPGGGAELWVCLPRAYGAPAPVPARSEPQPAGGARLLLVEDNTVLRHATAALLESAGYLVTAVESGDLALAILAAPTPIDVVVTDVVMPGISGPELAARAGALRRDLPFVFMSGYGDSAIGKHGLPPAAPYLQKPFPPEALVEAVEAARRAAPANSTASAQAGRAWPVASGHG